jgi:Apea-like HEPN
VDMDAIRAAIGAAGAPAEKARADEIIANYGGPGSPLALPSASLRCENLQKVLADQPEFAGNLMLSMAGNGWVSCLLAVPSALLTKAESEGFDKAIEWLLNLLAMQNAQTLRILPIWGLEVRETTVLHGEIRLVPISALPDSPTLHSLLNRLPGLSDPTIRWSPPTAALTVTSSVAPILIQSEETGAFSPFDTEAHELLHDVRKCLTLSGPVRLVSFEEWTQFVDDDLLFLMSSSPMTLRSTEIQPRSIQPLGAFDVAAAKEAVASYIQMSGPLKPIVRMAIDRFDRALRRHDPGDAAVEMSTALESVLGDGSGELVWKVSLRASIIAGGSTEHRKRVRAIVYALYALRSTVVHTGMSPTSSKVKGGPPMTAGELTNEGFNVVSEILRAALKLDTMPDWFEAEITTSSDHGASKAAPENRNNAEASNQDEAGQ